MNNIATALFGLLLLTATPGLAQSKADETKAAKAPAATISRKGVIKTIDDSSISLTPNDNKRATMSFALTPAAKRSGPLGVGDSAAVTYYLAEDGRPVVTELTGKAAK